ncbi:hypothetical protein DFS34DRAFT_652926 [Phlyctochytrium arcticum]|nr:hypothetical protein DFS34DRAFT_652926 [Phlyctochytrium arcticum]
MNSSSSSHVRKVALTARTLSNASSPSQTSSLKAPARPASSMPAFLGYPPFAQARPAFITPPTPPPSPFVGPSGIGAVASASEGAISKPRAVTSLAGRSNGSGLSASSSSSSAAPRGKGASGAGHQCGGHTCTACAHKLRAASTSAAASKQSSRDALDAWSSSLPLPTILKPRRRGAPSSHSSSEASRTTPSSAATSSPATGSSKPSDE